MSSSLAIHFQLLNKALSIDISFHFYQTIERYKSDSVISIVQLPNLSDARMFAKSCQSMSNLTRSIYLVYVILLNEVTLTNILKYPLLRNDNINMTIVASWCQNALTKHENAHLKCKHHCCYAHLQLNENKHSPILQITTGEFTNIVNPLKCGIQSKLFITSLVITEYSISDIKLLGTDLFPLKFPLYNKIFT